jgi:GntR family transcriptional repressor for pyruvate dehydrogenase complex
MTIPDRSRSTEVRVSKTAELIANELRSRIARGLLKPGDVLPAELELVKQFNVSRPTLREAFRILENESLIVIRRGSRGGVLVASPDISVVARSFGLILQMSKVTMADIFATGTVLEGAAAAMLAKRRTQADIRALHKRVGELEALLDDGDIDIKQWTKAALRFHDVIVERSRNASLELIATVLREVVGNHMAHVAIPLKDASTRRHFKKTVDVFKKLVSLIEAQEEDEVVLFWRRETERAGKGKLWGWLTADTVIDVFVDVPVLRQLNSPSPRTTSTASSE